jgi:hypothetical protein
VASDKSLESRDLLFMWLLIWWSLEVYMIVNFRTREIIQDTHNLTQTPTLINKINCRFNPFAMRTKHRILWIEIIMLLVFALHHINLGRWDQRNILIQFCSVSLEEKENEKGPQSPEKLEKKNESTNWCGFLSKEKKVLKITSYLSILKLLVLGVLVRIVIVDF